MKKLAALPTYVLCMLFLPFFRKDHPWHNRNFTLKDWHRHQTRSCKEFDYVFWTYTIVLVWLLLQIG